MQNARDFMNDLARSVAFLSRLPVPARFFLGHDGSVSRACRAFPLAGWLIALIPALVLMLLASWPEARLMACLLSLVLLALMTGGLHEDGLADSVDGLFGGRDRDHALTIMKDSRIGSFGVIGLIASFGLRASALVALCGLGSNGLAALALAAAASFSRGLMVWHWAKLPPARQGGTAVAMGQPEAKATRFALGLGTFLTLPLLVSGVSPLSLLASLGLSLGAAHIFTTYVQRKIGGHTGDTIGATQQITEMTLLFALVVTF
ncbi:adenosylcobinamide-GDP ribazoletransferase [Rhizobium helianthi]|uniref:Adenosylcobinamide-GDP ribazoletransferase n=1 Tax=Rhizobium helianthi TaxID=1132695 RepID=A0ABW4M015_9HYPH